MKKEKNYKERGLIGKYNISKTDGSPVNDKAEYFVLRYDPYQTDKKHMEACHIALLAYADAIEEHLPLLAKDLRTEIANYGG